MLPQGRRQPGARLSAIPLGVMKHPLLTSLGLVLSCACATVPERPPAAPALPYLMVENGHLGWGRIVLGMTRAELEARLGVKLAVAPNPAGCMCGDWESHLDVNGRTISIAWSSKATDARVLVITVPYGGPERYSWDRRLSDAATARIPELVDPDGEATEKCPSSFLVLRDNPEEALNLKPSGEGIFFVTMTGCVE